MNGDGLYLTTYECALAVVATSMKKARLPLETLIINSFIGGVLFTSGGMLHVMVQSECPRLFLDNPGLVSLMQGLLYPIGLFYVVVMGVDLFNSNILFFSVGLARGAVSMLDLIISWIVSWWINLAGTIFVCYIVCHFSTISSLANWVAGSIAILDHKLEFNFAQNLLKAMAGNFFVCLAVYLQLMAKPLHVKFLLMLLPIFTFVSLGFTHSVADMFMIIIGLINGAPTSVGTVAWKLFLPGVIGNIIGGIFFSLVIPWYLHIVAVEKDQKRLNLPRYEMRDQQPEINQDSRVVRAKEDEEDEHSDIEDGAAQVSLEKNLNTGHASDRLSLKAPSMLSRRAYMRRSPSNVFPVYGMGRPGERERSIASGAGCEHKQDTHTPSEAELSEQKNSATFLGASLLRTLSRLHTQKDSDPYARDTEPNSTSYSRGLPLSCTPNSINEGSICFTRGFSNGTAQSQPKGFTNAKSVVAPDAILERSSNEVAISPKNSILDVTADQATDDVSRSKIAYI